MNLSSSLTGLLGPALLWSAVAGHAAPATAAPLGRLFSTPAERLRLDEARKGAGPASTAVNAAANAAANATEIAAANAPANLPVSMPVPVAPPEPGSLTGMPPAPQSPPLTPPSPLTSSPPPPPPAEQIVVNGVLRRSTGKNTVWINQQAHDNVRLNGQAGKTAAQLKLSSGQRISLKPGQRYDVEAARVKDSNEP